MRDYELMVVLDPNLDESTQDSTTRRIGTLITQRGGSVTSAEPWGRRRLAYPIGRNRDGAYVLLKFQGGSTVANELERTLKVMESVLRHLLVRTEVPQTAPARS